MSEMTLSSASDERYTESNLKCGATSSSTNNKGNANTGFTELGMESVGINVGSQQLISKENTLRTGAGHFSTTLPLLINDSSIKDDDAEEDDDYRCESSSVSVSSDQDNVMNSIGKGKRNSTMKVDRGDNSNSALFMKKQEGSSGNQGQKNHLKEKTSHLSEVVGACGNEEIDWSSIIPSPVEEALTSLSSDEAFAEISRRVRRECQYLCLFPTPEFFANNSGGNPERKVVDRSTREWLRCAVSLVSSKLNLDSPNPIGWGSEYGDSLPPSLCGQHAHWMVGIKGRLKGPQPWFATRTYIANTVVELLDADGCLKWATSKARWTALEVTTSSTIRNFLIGWRLYFNRDENLGLLNRYASQIWYQFVADRLNMLNTSNAAVVPLYDITYHYVRSVGRRIEKRGILPPAPDVTNESANGSDDDNIDGDSQSMEKQRSILLKKVRKVQFDYFPLMRGGEKALEGVRDTIWQRLLSKTPISESNVSPVVYGYDVSSSKHVVSILNDLEDETRYLTQLNGLLQVRVDMSSMVAAGTDRKVAPNLCLESSVGVLNCRVERRFNEKNAYQSSRSEGQQSDTRYAQYSSDDADSIPACNSRKKKRSGSGELSSAYASSVSVSSCPGGRQELSKTREVGSRVYAQYNQGDFYWGNTIGVTEVKKKLNTKPKNEKKSSAVSAEKEYRYSIIFDDGDICEGLKPSLIYTEYEYKKFFKVDPPPPPRTRKRRKSQLTVAAVDKPQSFSSKTNASLRTSQTDFFHPKRSDIEPNCFRGALSPAELQGTICKNCTLCRMPDCMRCATCVAYVKALKRMGKVDRIEICLRKICCKIPNQVKSQPANGFPPGWSFVFSDPQRTSLTRYSSRVLPLPGLTLSAPDESKYHSIRSAFNRFGNISADHATRMIEEFLVHVGSSHYLSYPDHFLVGREYCHEFTHGTGCNFSLYGIITACMRDCEIKPGDNKDERTFFVVQYNPDVLKFAYNDDVNVQPSQLITSELAWGGCVAYERKVCSDCFPGSVIRSIDQATECETWIVPDMQCEAMVEGPDGKTFPQLSIFVRGYKLVLSVDKSNNPNAQYGVFVSCVPMRSNSPRGRSEEGLNLKPGDLVDLGVWPSVGEGDKKLLSVVIVKNYIYSFKCEHSALLAAEDEYIYDFTCEQTGNLHPLASRHIHGYVQNCRENEIPTIHSRLDPCGNIHFLFGVPYRGNWEDYQRGMQGIIRMTKGEKLEIAKSHGTSLRLRESSGELENLTANVAVGMKKARRYLQAIQKFDVEDISACINYLVTVFPDTNAVIAADDEVIRRSLRVAHCLKERVRELLAKCEEIRSTLCGDRDGINATAFYRALQSIEDFAKLIQSAEDS